MALTEKSYFWTTGTTNDGSTTFTQADMAEAIRIVSSCQNSVGVAGGYLNAFAATIPGANAVQIDTGAAIVDGKPYSNLGAGNIAIPSAVGGGNTRIDRIVLRADWANHQVRLTRIAGTDAASPTAPAITQTPGTTYDVKLFQVTVNTTGVVTVTLDERVFAQISALNQIAAALITGAKVAADTIAASNIANRARKFMAPVTGTLNNDLTAALMAGGNYGPVLKDNNTCKVDGAFIVPSDYASGMTVKAMVVSPSASGNMAISGTATGGQPGASDTAHSASQGLAAVAITQNLITAIWTLDLSAASFVAGDVVLLTFARTGASGSDTINADANFAGFLVEYTADM